VDKSTTWRRLADRFSGEFELFGVSRGPDGWTIHQSFKGHEEQLFKLLSSQALALLGEDPTENTVGRWLDRVALEDPNRSAYEPRAHQWSAKACVRYAERAELAALHPPKKGAAGDRQTSAISELLTVKEVAAEAKVSEKTIRRDMAKGALPFKKGQTGRIRIRREDLDVYKNY